MQPQAPTSTSLSLRPSDDFTGAGLPDRRLVKRVVSAVAALDKQPAASFPTALGQAADREGFYRLLANARVPWSVLLTAHADATRRRAGKTEPLLVIHDTTLVQFSGDVVREGTCQTTKGKCGFYAHVALAVDEGSRRALGVLGMIPVVRGVEGGPGRCYENESHRWLDLVEDVESDLEDGPKAIHVMDSEGDNYALWDGIVDQGADAVVRQCQDRACLDDGTRTRLSTVLRKAVPRSSRKATLSRRKPPARGPKPTSRRHAPRDQREATLQISTAQATMVRPKQLPDGAPQLTLNIVVVEEVGAPEGQEPVSWWLATTLPCSTAAEAERVVDIYRTRWLIEEWFKSLKTGCGYQKKQLESLDALLKAFAMLAPIASRLLNLRWLGRNASERPATEVFDAIELKVLRALDPDSKRSGHGMPRRPTIGEAMMAVARLGGFIRQNKVAGWQVLGRGLERLIVSVDAVKAMNSEM